MTLFDIYVSIFIFHDNTVSNCALKLIWGILCDRHKNNYDLQTCMKTIYIRQILVHVCPYCLTGNDTWPWHVSQNFKIAFYDLYVNNCKTAKVTWTLIIILDLDVKSTMDDCILTHKVLKERLKIIRVEFKPVKAIGKKQENIFICMHICSFINVLISLSYRVHYCLRWRHQDIIQY